MTLIKKQMPRIIIQWDFNTNQLMESWCRLILLPIISPSVHYAMNLLYTWRGLFCRCIDNHPGYLCIWSSRLPSKNLIGIRQHRHRYYYPLDIQNYLVLLWFFHSYWSFTSISLLTNASEWSCGVETSWSLTSAWIGYLTFIYIKAEITISSESFFTWALETTGSVDTVCIGVTTIINTFINILTSIWSHWDILLGKSP